MADVVLGLDIGTSRIKILAYDPTGKIVASVYNTNTYNAPQKGWAELSMETLWNTVVIMLKIIRFKLGNHHVIKGIGITAFMGGCWLLDKFNKPVRPSILWNDGRAIDVMEDLKYEKKFERCFEISGNIPTTGFSLVLLRWLKKHEPNSIEKAKTLLFAKDYIRFKLTNELFTESTDASHAPGDIYNRNFSEQLILDWDIPEAIDLLPPVVSSSKIAGAITRKVSEITGIATGTPVIAGLADVSSSLIGSGTIKPGDACTILGTSCLNSVITETPITPPLNIGLNFLIPRLWARTMPNPTGTIALEWFKREIATNLTDSELEKAVSKVPLGSNNLIFHPYMNNTGIIAPSFSPSARGQLSGLTLEHSQFDILRSIYEGVAFAINDCLNLLPKFKEPIRFIGGGSRNKVWTEIIANVTGKTFEIFPSLESGCLGVALLTGTAIGWWDDVEQATEHTSKNSHKIFPKEEAFYRYQPIIESFNNLRNKIIANKELLG